MDINVSSPVITARGFLLRTSATTSFHMTPIGSAIHTSLFDTFIFSVIRHFLLIEVFM
jgi:hypothetical protein